MGRRGEKAEAVKTPRELGNPTFFSGTLQRHGVKKNYTIFYAVFEKEAVSVLEAKTHCSTCPFNISIHAIFLFL